MGWDDGDGGGTGAGGDSRGWVGEGAGEREVGRWMRVAGRGGVVGAVDRGGGGEVGAVRRRGGCIIAVDRWSVWRRWYGTDRRIDGKRDRSANLGLDCGVWGCEE